MNRLVTVKGLSLGFCSLLFVPALFAGDAQHSSHHDLRGLQELSQSEQIPFAEVVLATTGHRVLDFDTNNAAHVELRQKLLAAAALVGERAAKDGLIADRAGDAAATVEPYLRAALHEVGIDSLARSSHTKPSGYPGIEVTNPAACYIGIKTYHAGSAHGGQPAFNYAPSNDPKITRDAIHFLLAFQLEKVARTGQRAYVPIRWKLLTLENLTVDVKCEFNQSNRHVFGPESRKAVVAEGEVP
jgi:hypothetical protein